MPQVKRISVANARVALRIDASVLSNIRYRKLRLRVQQLMVHFNAISQTSPNWLPLQAYIVSDEHVINGYRDENSMSVHYASLGVKNAHTGPTKSGNEYSGVMNLPSQQPDSVTDLGLYES